jgi:hypothetical protein
MQALAIITDAYERCNRLSPGETLNADDAAFGFRRLNLLVDEMSASNLFLFKSVLTSAAQTGAIALGAGAWAAISPGDEIVSATANNQPLTRITMQQYNELYQPTTAGFPSFYAQDGLGTVYLWPVAAGQTIKLQTRVGVSSFADQNTDYIMPDGYAAALGAGLAVRIAPSILGAIPPYLIKAEAKCMGSISRYEPAIVDVHGFAGGRSCYPPRLF